MDVTRQELVAVELLGDRRFVLPILLDTKLNASRVHRAHHVLPGAYGWASNHGRG